MGKVRIVHSETGQVKLVSQRVAQKTALLKNKGWIIQDVEEPTPVEAAPVKEVEVIEAPDLNAPTLEELKAKYKELYGKKPHHSWKEEKLTEKIKDKENE